MKKQYNICFLFITSDLYFFYDDIFVILTDNYAVMTVKNPKNHIISVILNMGFL